MAGDHIVLGDIRPPSDDETTVEFPPSSAASQFDTLKSSQRPYDDLENTAYATVVDLGGAHKQREGNNVDPHPLPSDIEPPKGLKLVLLMLTLLLVEVIVGLDNTIVATSTATIANDFQRLTDVGWYGSAYLLTCVAFQPLAGRAFAFFPQKWVFLICLAIFNLGCLVAAVAPSSSVLILGRALQGLGYAGLFIGILAIASNTLPIRMQAVVTSLMNVSYGSGTVMGPLIGGALTSNLTWRWCFWVLLMGGGLALGLGVWLLNPPPIPQELTVKQRIARMDWGGAFLLLGSMVCLLIALQEGGITSPWSSSKMCGLLVGFVALLCAFFALQTKLGEKSSISIRLLTHNRSLACTSFVNFTCGASFYLLLYFVPIWFQTVKAATPVQAGINLLPLIALNMTMGIVAGWTVSRFGTFHPAMLFGLACTAIGSGLHATMDASTSTARWAGYGAVLGSGMGALYMMSFLASQMLAEPADRSKASSLVCFFQILGGTIWVSAGNSIYTNTFKRGISKIPGVDVQAVLDSGVDRFREVVDPAQLPAVVDVAVDALWDVFVTAAVIAAAGFVAALGIRWVRIEEDKGAKKDDEKQRVEESDG
ncbi:major facilitator superfamily domain-containing protein [Rhodotorula diobovata]|uniref:Major facilitator superfamily domain-containing protein n=1 Tax=Rhodotorula diobovata TaxID=5288 RepID=A0A5C5FYP5_9BASI|nr:major facilitator superfamily domain-containing protein [Rhodotorula diobovata]